MLHDPKTVIGSDFDQETGEKIAPQLIARLQLANCTCFFLTKSVTLIFDALIVFTSFKIIFWHILRSRWSQDYPCALRSDKSRVQNKYNKQAAAASDQEKVQNR